MWRFLTKMSIARRLMIAATLTAFIPGIVISILGSSYIGTLSTINDTVQTGNSAVKLATDMQADLLRMNALLGALNAPTISAVDNIKNSHEIVQLVNDYNSALSTYKQDYQITTSAKMKSVRDALQGDSLGAQAPISQHSMIYVVDLQWQLYSDAQSQVLLDVQHNVTADALAADVAQANLEYLPLKGNLDNLVVLTESISQIVAQVNAFKINPIFFWTIMAFLFSTLVVFAISYLINLTITRPLRQLVQLTERIALGETNARASLVGHDETYMVATSMNTMLDSIVSLMQNIQRQHDFLEARVQKLIVEVKGLGSGDLRARAEVTSDALGFLAHSFNYMVDELSSLVVRVKNHTLEVAKLTGATQLRLTQGMKSSDQQMLLLADAVMVSEQLAVLTLAMAEQSQAIFVGSAQSSQTTESLNASFTRQCQLSQALLQTLKSVVEITERGNENLHEAEHGLNKLSQRVELLQASMSLFKFHDEPGAAQIDSDLLRPDASLKFHLN